VRNLPKPTDDEMATALKEAAYMREHQLLLKEIEHVREEEIRITKDESSNFGLDG